MASPLIRIESNIPGVGLLAVNKTLLNHLRLVTVTMTEEFDRFGNVMTYVREVPTERSDLLRAKRELPDGVEIYVQTPPAPAAPQTMSFPRLWTDYRWAVRSQILFETRNGTFAFPPPPADDPLRYSTGGEKGHGIPNFKKTGEPFWADEQSHRAEIIQ